MQPRYQLSYFEKLIRIDLRKASTEQKEPDRSVFESILSDTLREKNSMLECFGRYLYDLGKRKQVAWYISMHQHQLVLLMDQMAIHLPEDDLISCEISLTDTTWLNLYKHIYSALNELLSFLESQFTRYLDINCKIPSSYLIIAKIWFAVDWDDLQQTFDDTVSDKDLLSIIFQPIAHFLNADTADESISYRRLYFLKELKRKLTELLEVRRENEYLTDKLKDLLLYLNFNSIQYIDYWTAIVTREIEEMPTVREKLDRLIFLQKKVSQALTKPGFVFNTLDASLQNQLLSWLTDEILYYKEKGQLAGNGHTSDELARWKDFKVLTAFSVPQLGNIIKLLMESGFYLNKNKTEVLDFFSHFFATVKQDSVSAGSLRSNFYKDNAAVSKAVRDILMDLVNVSRKGTSIIS